MIPMCWHHAKSLSVESESVWRRRRRRPQLFEKSGFARFSTTAASRIQTSLHAAWHQTEKRPGEKPSWKNRF
jgi:hypothetical protein